MLSHVFSYLLVPCLCPDSGLYLHSGSQVITKASAVWGLDVLSLVRLLQAPHRPLVGPRLRLAFFFCTFISFFFSCVLLCLLPSWSPHIISVMSQQVITFLISRLLFKAASLFSLRLSEQLPPLKDRHVAFYFLIMLHIDSDDGTVTLDSTRLIWILYVSVL